MKKTVNDWSLVFSGSIEPVLTRLLSCHYFFYVFSFGTRNGEDTFVDNVFRQHMSVRTDCTSLRTFEREEQRTPGVPVRWIQVENRNYLLLSCKHNHQTNKHSNYFNDYLKVPVQRRTANSRLDGVASGGDPKGLGRG
jgi:hypothetical protein